MHFVFVSTFNLRERAIVIATTNLSKQAVCVKAKAPGRPCVSEENGDEFKRVLSVAHASQPIASTEL
jgi:hypothetical protein